MKRILLSILLIGILLLGACGAPTTAPPTEAPPTPPPTEQPEPMPTAPETTPEMESDAEQIEAVLREYYEAFNCYDLDRVEKVIAEEALKGEGAEILLSVAWAESMNFKCQLKSITSIQIDGDSALAIVECETSLGSGEDTWHLVREHGNWRLAAKELTETATPTPTLTPQPVPEPEPIAFSGQGDDVSSKFTLESGITIITMTHNGDSNFAINLLDNTGGLVDLLVNEIGVFDGSVAMGVREDNIIGAKPGTHLLDITADGNWTVLIEQPRPTSADALPLNLTGKGCDVSPFFVLGEGLTVFKMTHDGDSNFAITLLSADGRVAELLVNEIGSYSGKKAIGVKQGNIIGARPGIHILSIIADGNWTVSISQ